ncbi:MAG TPA: hypothetical protein VE826_03845 [Dongiaceae bacterium]|nr:hypothetical protein [Dongiaceae bacterium]
MTLSASSGELGVESVSVQGDAQRLFDVLVRETVLSRERLDGFTDEKIEQDDERVEFGREIEHAKTSLRMVRPSHDSTEVEEARGETWVDASSKLPRRDAEGASTPIRSRCGQPQVGGTIATMTIASASAVSTVSTS